MLKHNPDFFVHSGDTIYADGPFAAEKEMPNGEIWKSIVTEEKSKVAETLHEFRHNYLYNMLDTHLRAFNAAVLMMAQWDDHETVNNWYPGEVLTDDRYAVKSVDLLASRANRAFREMMPMRESAVEPGRIYRKISYGPLLDIFFIDMPTYRSANSKNDQSERSESTSFLGQEQFTWLKRGLANSRATWKVIASDMPIGMVVGDGDNFENGANGDGAVRGREFDIAEILSFMKHAGVKNTIWPTADVHYTAAHHYSPDRAQFQDFDPFYELVSGLLHAGTFGQNKYDNTIGPEVLFAKAPEGGVVNLPPSYGLQFFGKVDIDGATGAMKVSLLDAADTVQWSKELAPAQGGVRSGPGGGSKPPPMFYSPGSSSGRGISVAALRAQSAKLSNHAGASPWPTRTSPIVRLGSGTANRLSRMPRASVAAAISGSSVAPCPEATICASVTRLAAPNRRRPPSRRSPQALSAWSPKQCPSYSSSRLLAETCSGRATGCNSGASGSGGSASRNRSSNSSAACAGAIGTGRARTAASITPSRNSVSKVSVTALRIITVPPWARINGSRCGVR